MYDEAVAVLQGHGGEDDQRFHDSVVMHLQRRFGRNAPALKVFGIGTASGFDDLDAEHRNARAHLGAVTCPGAVAVATAPAPGLLHPSGLVCTPSRAFTRCSRDTLDEAPLELLIHRSSPGGSPPCSRWLRREFPPSPAAQVIFARQGDGAWARGARQQPSADWRDVGQRPPHPGEA